MTPEFENIMRLAPYSLNKSDKKKLFQNYLYYLNQHHYYLCEPYKKIVNALSFNVNLINSLDDIPFLPVRLFKSKKLYSIHTNNIDKLMTSSGTSGAVSKIYLDRETSFLQSKVLSKIVCSYIGEKRLPLLVLDTKSILANRNSFSARAAGILGFSMLGYDVTYALDENFEINLNVVNEFLKKHTGKPILLFGFTYIIWEYFFQKIKKINLPLILKNAILFHGGGWKKMQENSVENVFFKKSLNELTGIEKIYNYYGMIEQAGSIFVECEKGYLHCPVFSDVIVRNNHFLPCSEGESGFIQLISLLPHSYPGHSILTEDEGEIIGEDNCACGRLGKYFKVHGRIQQAEIRGCSDAISRN